MIKTFKTIYREKRKQRRYKKQTQERQAYNKMQRGKSLKPAERQAARSFIAKGKPKVKW
jgi:hypothetical protein